MRQPQPKKPFKDEDEERNAVQLQHDISEHEATITRLQKVLKSKDEVVRPLLCTCVLNRSGSHSANGYIDQSTVRWSG